ncbi:MAG: hypothetical protein IJQ28_03170 [Clostridia bacterium]|nr:hypothetical protein [Clostridia bacterium]
MELYKFIDENSVERYSGGFIVLDNRIYTNPTEEIVRAVGYKDLVEDEKPEYDVMTQYLAEKYQDGETIRKYFVVMPLPDDVGDGIDDSNY